MENAAKIVTLAAEIVANRYASKAAERGVDYSTAPEAELREAFEQNWPRMWAEIQELALRASR